jgi:hypothetical protein
LNSPGFFITSERTILENGRSHERIRQEAQAFLKKEADFFNRPVRMSADEWMRNFYSSLPGTGRGNVQRNRDQVVDLLSVAARVPREHVIITPWMPGSKTGDVDEYTALLTGNAVVVAKIIPESISSRGFRHERDYADMLNQWLEARAGEFQKRGLSVHRIPMFAPVNLRPNEFGGYNPDLLTTVNWARFNNHVIAPDFSAYLIKHGHPADLVRKLQKQIEDETREVLGQYGMSAEFIDASGLVGSFGGLHCISAVEYQIARFSLPQD